ncbi:AAA family ATPase [Amycolatopsis thailandensis]|uniref:AAA family ATPase n=1 Tax=Amycolatopsis thailandensis TaxID=589330 RepID=UPI00363538AE
MMTKVEEILDAIPAAGTPLVVITGLAGAGRTTLLAKLCRGYAAEGRHVSAVRFTAAGNVVPANFVLPEAGDATGLRGPVRDEPAWGPIGPIRHAAEDPQVASRAARAANTALRRTGDGTVLLLDDLHWIDRDSVAVVEALIRLLAHQEITCVGTLRIPLSGSLAGHGAEVLARLREENLVTTLRLRPLDRRQVSEAVTEALSAVPEPPLVDRLHLMSGGLRAALSEATDTLRRQGAIRIVDRTAYLVPGRRTATPGSSRYTEIIHESGPATWTVAKAMAILSPLGAAAPALVEEVTNVPGSNVAESLDTLRAAGVLHLGARGTSWRFTVPFAATVLGAACGPYERRALAAAAVGAVWSGTAQRPPPDRFADLLAEGGRLIDPARATEELLAATTATSGHNAESMAHSLASAVEMADDGGQRSRALLALAAVLDQLGAYEKLVPVAEVLLDEHTDQLSPDKTFEVQAMLLRGLSGNGATEKLEDLARGKRLSRGDAGHRAASRSLAYAALDRWAEAEQQASGEQARDAVVLTRLLRVIAPLWQGRPEPFERSLRERARWPMRASRAHLLEQVDTHLTGLLVQGDLDRAEKLLSEEGFDWTDMRPANRTIAAGLKGNFEEATALVCRSVANRSAHPADSATAGMYRAAISALTCQGRLSTARELLALARETPPVLAHLLEFTEAQIDRALGETQRAKVRLADGLSHAADRGLLVGTDLAYAELADLRLDEGDRRGADHILTAAEGVAARLSTARADLQAYFVRAAVSQDPVAAEACLRLAHERAQPIELALLIVRLVKHGAVEPALLSEAYELLGRVGALLLRAQARSLMGEHGIAVPGRQKTLVENEHLLAVLASEGLSNRLIASVLNTSERSVEGRLSRLFTRTGYRSRIALSAAMTSGALRF